MSSRRLWKIGGLVALVSLIVPFVVHAVPAVVGAEHSFVVLSGSMMPAISPGDSVIVADRDPATIQDGEIITFTLPGSEVPTTHRVIGVEQRADGLAFRTKGDANEGPDPGVVPESNVLGAVVFTIPAIGHVIQFVNTPLGFGLLVGLPLGVLAVTEVRSLLGASRSGSTSSESADHPAGDQPGEGDDAVQGTSTEATPTDSEPTTADDSPDPADTQSATPDADAADPDTDTATIEIRPADLAGTVGLLALVVPYSIYVAVQLQNTLTFSVMFGSAFLLVVSGWLWLADRS